MDCTRAENPHDIDQAPWSPPMRHSEEVEDFEIAEESEDPEDNLDIQDPSLIGCNNRKWIPCPHLGPQIIEIKLDLRERGWPIFPTFFLQGMENNALILVISFMEAILLRHQSGLTPAVEPDASDQAIKGDFDQKRSKIRKYARIPDLPDRS